MLRPRLAVTMYISQKRNLCMESIAAVRLLFFPTPVLRKAEAFFYLLCYTNNLHSNYLLLFGASKHESMKHFCPANLVSIHELFANCLLRHTIRPPGKQKFLLVE